MVKSERILRPHATRDPALMNQAPQPKCISQSLSFSILRSFGSHSIDIESKPCRETLTIHLYSDNQIKIKNLSPSISKQTNILLQYLRQTENKHLWICSKKAFAATRAGTGTASSTGAAAALAASGGERAEPRRTMGSTPQGKKLRFSHHFSAGNFSNIISHHSLHFI